MKANLQTNSPLIKVKKGEILLRQGDKCLYTYIVLKGCLKGYVIDQSGKEHILQFAPEGSIITDLDSFINEIPATIFIDAIMDSEYTTYEKQLIPKLDELSKKELIDTLTQNVIEINRILINLLSCTAEVRYLEFIAKYPDLLQRLPLKLIASHIGITPEYLSEIRAKQLKK
jgi:CRP-like cAMP-binding protein